MRKVVDVAADSKVPRDIGGATVLLYTPIDGRHRATGACTHIVGGVIQPPFAALAICRYGDGSYGLLYFDEEWNEITDTWHQTLDDAKNQAEMEFVGVSKTWQSHEEAR
jgi:hypothetical protein